MRKILMKKILTKKIKISNPYFLYKYIKVVNEYYQKNKEKLQK